MREMRAIVVKHYVDSDVVKDCMWIEVRHSYETGLVNINRDAKYEPIASSMNIVFGDPKEEHMFFVPEKFTDEEILGIDKKIEQTMQFKSEGSCINLIFVKYGTFDKYLKFLKAGKEISRKAWSLPQRSILYGKGYESRNPFNCMHDKYDNVAPHLEMREGKEIKDYQLTIEDIMADDWYIVEPSHNMSEIWMF